MKKFNNFKDAFEYVGKVIEKGLEMSKQEVAKQVYADSDEFTYRDTGDMYKSGELHSKFEDGVVIERSPYVRRRYYEGGKPGAGNRQAQPRWFEKTIAKHKKEYVKQVTACLNEAKKKV